MMPSISYLVTTYKKTDNEIIELIKSTNIVGSIIVGNQCSLENKINSYKIGGVDLTIINQTSRGVSLNRNTLLKYCTSNFITFLDDDMYIDGLIQQDIESIIFAKNLNCIRFNVVSDNCNRPIKQLKKKGYIHFRDISSFGVCGCFYKRTFLLENKIFFNEKIGPGTEINHGEDAVFNKDFLKCGKIYSFPRALFHAKQEESTWHSNRDLNIELFSHGYNYYYLYKNKSRTMAILFLLTHMKCYPKNTKFSFLKKCMFEGIKKAKEDQK